MERMRSARLSLFFALTLLCLSVGSAQAAKVYVITAGDSPTNLKVKDVLEAAGHIVTLGASISTFDGTQTDLGAYDVAVLLNNYSYVTEIPPGGKAALIKFLCGGGGIVTGEWVNYYAVRGGFQVLSSLLRQVDVPTYGSGATTTYAQETPDPILNAGVTSPLTFGLDGTGGGTEASFTELPSATVFYRSSMGGGAPNSPGVVGGTALNGKVISFSVLLTLTSFQSPDFSQLFSNAVTWAAPPPPPTARNQGSHRATNCEACGLQ